ncbi:hypothetical protein DOTSEDRAFT_21859 [Dothistroma septosporum NZE10]|uniref:G domain-containing protein n=1 Tax=Dothistroma septosporum (strain NZE10 / CBS 128990) TaxID=675120 RepID=N1PXL4_DOTSN|nr:hypothetical protein DOTSEDRAFT_21859 [Dothistroma septosporum NZE10]
MTDNNQTTPAFTATLDDSMFAGIKREREDSPLFEPPEGAENGGEGDHNAQEQTPGRERSKRRKTEPAVAPLIPTPTADDHDEPETNLTDMATQEDENPFGSFNFNVADLDASGTETIGHLGFREGYPEVAAYHLAFPLVERKVNSICDFLINYIDQLRALGWKEKDIIPMYEELQTLRNPSHTYPSPEPPAFFGSTGKGKSSTMNALLGTLKAAYEHSGTNRGTYVTHVYMTAPLSQPPGHMAKVHYLDDRGVSVQLFRLCGHVINHLNFDLRTKEDEEDDEEDESEEDFSSYEQKYDTALECLHDALCSEEKFATQDKVAKYLKDLVKKCIKVKMTTDQQVKQLMDDLLPRIKLLVDSRKRVDGVEIIEAFDAQTFQRELKRCTRAARSKDLEACRGHS